MVTKRPKVNTEHTFAVTTAKLGTNEAKPKPKPKEEIEGGHTM